MTRLNGWQRIGVILSGLWIIFGAFWGNELGLAEGDYVVQRYLDCLDGASGPGHFEVCGAAFASEWHGAISNHWLYAGLMAFLPLVLFWFLVWIVLRLTRWVYAGFRLSAGK